MRGLFQFFGFLVGFALLTMGSLVFWIVIGSYVLPCHNHEFMGRVLEGDMGLSESIVLDNLDPLFDE